MGMSQTNYCSNCKKLSVCKYASLITQFDAQVEKFNKDNTPMPIRISITTNNYNCRHKETI